MKRCPNDLGIEQLGGLISRTHVHMKSNHMISILVTPLTDVGDNFRNSMIEFGSVHEIFQKTYSLFVDSAGKFVSIQSLIFNFKVSNAASG